jgi:hypothetical protein
LLVALVLSLCLANGFCLRAELGDHLFTLVRPVIQVALEDDPRPTAGRHRLATASLRRSGRPGGRAGEGLGFLKSPLSSRSACLDGRELTGLGQRSLTGRGNGLLAGPCQRLLPRQGEGLLAGLRLRLSTGPLLRLQAGLVPRPLLRLQPGLLAGLLLGPLPRLLECPGSGLLLLRLEARPLRRLRAGLRWLLGPRLRLRRRPRPGRRGALLRRTILGRARLLRLRAGALAQRLGPDRH